MLETFKDDIVIFPERVEADEGMKVCRSFGGTIFITTTKEDFVKV